MPEITETTLGFPFKGTLRRSPFPKIVRQLARTKSTGSLYLLNGKTKKVVFFNEGEPISVRSNVTAECLGQVLAREGLITQAQCDQTLESIRRTGKKQGELLVEMGILSEGNLRYGLEAQLRNKLYDIFSWDDGQYQYKPDVEGDDYGLRLSIRAQGLIIDALLETTEEVHAKRSLEPFRDRFPVVDPDGISLELTPEEDYFLACLDGSRSIGELLETPSDPVVPSVSLLLYASIQAGIAKLSKSRRQQRVWPDKPADGRVKPDAELTPDYARGSSITSYEDTPLPGQLPKPPGEHLEDDDFGVDDSDAPQPTTREVSSVLVAAERDAPDETFDGDDELELTAQRKPAANAEPAPLLVADPAESGVFARVLEDDDDDDQPFGNPDDDDEGSTTVDVEAATREVDAATVEVDAVPEPEPVIEAEPEPAPVIEPEPEPVIEAEPEAEPPMLSEPSSEPDELDEIEELEELEELEEIDEDDETAALTDDAGALAADDDLGDDLGDDLPDDLAIDPDLALDGELAGEAELDSALATSEDDLAALAADLEVDEDLALAGALPVGASAELVALDELDDLALDGDLAGDLAGDLDGDLDDLGEGDELDDLATEADLGHGPGGYDEDATSEADDETLGAMHFGDGEFALSESNWAQAVVHFETAYEHGVDIAELHTYLAWARFQASGQTQDMAEHALDLLNYAEEMNPNLALIYAYRSAVLLALGDHGAAQDAAQRALDIDPYDELAIDVMDKLV